MNNIFLTLLFLGLIILVVKFLQNRSLGNGVLGTASTEKLPYHKKDYLLTIAEKNFYRVLSQVTEKHDKLLFVKVRLEDLLWLPNGTENRFGLRNRIKSRHIDFVLCDKENIKPLIAIELDDSTHNQKTRIERDGNINRILQDAGLPILHIKVQPNYDSAVLENQIQGKLNKNEPQRAGNI